MSERVLVYEGSYHDSAFLMRVARDLEALEGVDEAVVLMGTEMNLALLANAGFEDEALTRAGPMDMVVALRAASAARLDAAEQELARLLDAALRGDAESAGAAAARYPSLAAALEAQAEANLVSVAVPGAYAGYVASRALDAGKHVFLFSNNVPLEEEIELKRRGVAQGLLVMGPDCGTAMLAGVGLGFANRVRRGRAGMVGASGTGLQELACLLHAAGQGISQAVGTGSRDLKTELDAAMSEMGLRLLAGDAQTEVIVLVAKHPAPAVAERVHGVLRGLGKPCVVRYLGCDPRPADGEVFYAASLDEAAARAAAALGSAPPPPFDARAGAAGLLGERARIEGRLVGLFGGGSLASEAERVCEAAGLDVACPDHPLQVEPLEGRGHLIVDTGEDFYTLGKPHPMVDQTVRCELIEAVGADRSVGLLLFDLVLGDGAHLDPAPELAAAVAAAREKRPGEAPPLCVVASVSGTDLDPQDSERQRRTLREAVIHVEPSAWRAASVAAAACSAREGSGS
ncbi:MAG: acyl-CoA synthetase FdrA [Deltaproteobacteria bacterium]|nr:acyl-CoA synthetase FdrA [Deltaproteobacteria bacterium]